MDGARTLLAVPYYLQVSGKCILKWDKACDPARTPRNRAKKFLAQDAFLARGFNACWTAALNRRGPEGLTHFCMIHVDVEPLIDWWLDRLLDEMREHGADLLSVVLPIKTGHGYTSTALEHKETGSLRRLTMAEVGAIPTLTFDAAGAGFPDYRLLASTGLWVADLSKPWVEKVWFEVRDRIFQDEDGNWLYETLPEDWHFSRLIHALGGKVMATTCVPAVHWGEMGYANFCEWGTEKADQETRGYRDWLG